MKTALVCGAGGFFGSHFVKRLKQESYFVVGADLKYPEFAPTVADAFLVMDLRKPPSIEYIFNTYKIDEVYQLASDVGGAGYIFSGNYDADIMSNSALININIAKGSSQAKVKKLFFPSSSCVYPEFSKSYSDCTRDVAFPAQPANEYGWEKLFSERVYYAFKRNYGLDVRIARLNGFFGPEGTWEGGKEKAPAAMCRKVASAKDGDNIDIWGNGEQTRSYLYIDECIDGVRLLMEHEQSFEPLNIGGEETVSINQLVEMIIGISGKKLVLNHIEGPVGIQETYVDNRLVYKRLNWKPSQPLLKGLEQTYNWVYSQVHDKYKET